MKFVLALIILQIVVLTASSAPEIQNIGPFSIYFDMNTTMNYSINPVQYNVPTGTVYQMLIKTDNSTLAQLSVVDNRNLTDSTLSMDKIIIDLNMNNMGYSNNKSVADIIIDGKKGFVFTGLNSEKMRLFQAYYWLDSKDCECGPVSVGKINVGIISSYPQNVTLNLLGSLRIEKATQSHKPETQIFLPPKIS